MAMPTIELPFAVPSHWLIVVSALPRETTPETSTSSVEGEVDGQYRDAKVCAYMLSFAIVPQYDKR